MRLIDADSLVARLMIESPIVGADPFDVVAIVNAAPTIEAYQMAKCEECFFCLPDGRGCLKDAEIKVAKSICFDYFKK